MAKRKIKKPTNKDLVYNIALLRQHTTMLEQKLMVLDSVINKYIEMKKDTTKFNKFLQDEIEKGADVEKDTDTKEATKASD